MTPFAERLLKSTPQQLLRHKQLRPPTHPGIIYTLVGVAVGAVMAFMIVWPANMAFAEREKNPLASLAIEAMMTSCQDTGVFAVGTALFACEYVGTLGGDLAGNENMPLAYQQERLKKYFRKGAVAMWMH